MSLQTCDSHHQPTLCFVWHRREFQVFACMNGFSLRGAETSGLTASQAHEGVPGVLQHARKASDSETPPRGSGP